MLTTTFIPVIVIAALVACAIILIDAGSAKQTSTEQINTRPETVDGEVVDIVEIIDASSSDAFDPDDVYVLNAEDNFGPEDEDPYITYSAKQR